MYTKEEKKALVKNFWQHFDNYCRLQPELAGRKKMWVLHRTGVPSVDLKFEPGRKRTMVMIECNHKDEDERLEMFENLLQYRSVLEEGLENALTWDLVYTRLSGEEVSRVYTSLENKDIHRQNDWHSMFQFMASNMNILQKNFMDIAEFLKDDAFA